MKTKSYQVWAAVLASLLLLAGLFSSCESASLSDEISHHPPNEDKGSVLIDFSDHTARTILPSLEPQYLKIQFIAPENSVFGSQFPEAYEVKKGVAQRFELFPGWYTAVLFAYMDRNQPPIAQGSVQIPVYAGQESKATIPLEIFPLNSDFHGQGIFAYDIATALDRSEIKTASLSITDSTGKIIERDVKSVSQGNIPIPCDYYSVQVNMKNCYGMEAVKWEVLWVYPSLLSQYSVTIESEDFFGEMGNAGITYSFDPNLPPVVLSIEREINWNDVLILQVKPTHERYEFRIDGKLQQSGSVTSYVLNAKDLALAPGNHLVSISGFNSAGIPWSESFNLKVLPKPKEKNVSTLYEDDLHLVYVSGGNVVGKSFEGVFIEGRNVKIDPFLIGKYHVWYDLWFQVRLWAESHGYRFANAGREGSMGIDGALPTSNSRHPVTCVTWRDMIVWCNALSEFLGKSPIYIYAGNIVRDATLAYIDDVNMNKANTGYRLLTEVEWEFAALGGNQQNNAWNYKYPGGNNLDELAWWDNEISTHPVGTKNPNSLGLYDLAGNVWDRLWDKYGYIDSLTPVDGPLAGYNRVGRGGCYWTLEETEHGYPLYWRSPGTFNWGANDQTTLVCDNTGFRIATSDYSKIRVQNYAKTIMVNDIPVVEYYASPQKYAENLFVGYDGNTMSLFKDGWYDVYKLCNVTSEMEQYWRDRHHIKQ